MKQKPFIARQGDVLIERVDELPSNLEPIPSERGKIVLAHGEITGHAHAILSKTVQHLAAQDADVTYLEVQEAVALIEHEEHATIELPPGKYRVVRQREYTPTEIRRVAD